MDTSVKRGDIYYADLSPVVGSEQGGVRPVLIIQNDTGNRYSPTVIAAAITSQTGKAKLPTHIDLPVDHSCGLSRDSVVLLEQVRTLDKKRLREHMGRVDDQVMRKVDNAIAVSFGLHPEQLGRNAVHRRAVIRRIDRRKQRDDLVTVLTQHRLQRQRGILSSAPVENRLSPLLYHDSESIE